MISRRTLLCGASSLGAALAALPVNVFATVKPNDRLIVVSQASVLPLWLQKSMRMDGRERPIVLDGGPLDRLRQLQCLAGRGRAAEVIAYVDASDRLLIDHIVRYGDHHILSDSADGASAVLVIRL